VSSVVYGAVFAAAAGISLGSVSAARAMSLRFGAVDHGGGRRVHEGVVPRLGGLGIYPVWAGITIAALACCGDPAQNPRLIGILLGSLLLLAVGWYDDVRSASVSAKLAAQVAAAVLVFLFGVRIEVLTNPVGDVFRLGWLELPLTVLWLVVITNAYNLIDGIDGLAAATGITICIGMVLLYTGTDSIGRLAIVALAGSLAGFLRHNFPPARIFMGDSGSQSVGFLLGALSLLSFAKATTLAALVLPLVVFGHPLVDLTYAVLRRYHRGQPLGVADREHLHHLLLDHGYSGRAALSIMVALNFGLLGLVLFIANRRLSGMMVFVALITIPAGIAYRIVRHVLAGGSVREEALALFTNQERRRALHQARLARRAPPAGVGRSRLEESIGSFVREAEIRGVRVALRAAGCGEQVVFRDDRPAAVNRFSVFRTVVREGSGFELLEVSVNRDPEGGRNCLDAAAKLADLVRVRLETESSQARTVPALAAADRPPPRAQGS
jgi:UDP-GlcNAc:undecaprenyl-phosphate GlcNAc-1-phosphate transferase